MRGVLPAERAGADASALPDFLWMEADQVVDESCAALEAGTVVCVPGLGNRALSTLTGLLPVDWAARIAGAMMERVQTVEGRRVAKRRPTRRRRSA